MKDSNKKESTIVDPLTNADNYETFESVIKASHIAERQIFVLGKYDSTLAEEHETPLPNSTDIDLNITYDVEGDSVEMKSCVELSAANVGHDDDERNSKGCWQSLMRIAQSLLKCRRNRQE